MIKNVALIAMAADLMVMSARDGNLFFTITWGITFLLWIGMTVVELRAMRDAERQP